MSTIDTSSLLSALARAQDELLRATESLCERDDEHETIVRTEVARALGAIVTARSEAEHIERNARELGVSLTEIVEAREAAEQRMLAAVPLDQRITRTGSRKPRQKETRR